MQSLAQVKTPLQVDAVYRERDLQLSEKIGNEVSEALSLLWNLNASLFQSSRLTIYHHRFIEKYGTSRTVPLLELLSEEKGLGSFLSMSTDHSLVREGRFNKLWDKWLNKCWQECLRDKKMEMVISETLIDELMNLAEEPPQDIEKAPLSFDVFCKIAANSAEDIEQGNYLVLFSYGTSQGASAFGRFFDLLHEEDQMQIREFLRTEEQLMDNSLFVELSYWPAFIRSANVALHPCLRSYSLDIEGKKGNNSLSLDDIYVGASFDRFYLTLKGGGIEIEASMSNLLNITYAPLPLQFMREVTLAKRPGLGRFPWRALQETATFLPRVRFEKVILSPAQWKVDAAHFSKQTVDRIMEEFGKWALQWNLPQYFYLADGDQELLLDRNHSAHLQEIASRLKQGISLVFTEYLAHAWIKSEMGVHSSELVIPFIKKPTLPKKNKSMIVQPYFSVPVEERWRLPASEWLYVKIYVSNEGEESFLLNHLTPFVEALRQDASIEAWFFIRYKDPETHLRLRVKLKSYEDFCALVSSIHDASLHWMSIGLIRNMHIASYEREIERYGGSELIQAAEEIFCVDTQAIIFLLQAVLNKELIWHASIFHALSIISFLKDFGLNRKEMIILLNEGAQNTSELKGYRDHKSQLITLVKALENKNSNLQEVELMRNISRSRSATFQSFSARLSEKNNKLVVLRNLLHMHCNRLGCIHQAEKRATLFAHHTLIQIENQEKNSVGSSTI